VKNFESTVQMCLPNDYCFLIKYHISNHYHAFEAFAIPFFPEGKLPDCVQCLTLKGKTVTC